MDINRLMIPVNKSASLVTSQAGCSESEELSPEQERECLVSRFTQVHREIAGLPKKHEHRKLLGLEILSLQDKITEANLKIKCSNVERVDISRYIIKICRERLGAYRWKSIIAEAKALKSQTESEFIKLAINKIGDL